MEWWNDGSLGTSSDPPIFHYSSIPFVETFEKPLD
jgi:hypothetical protein